MSTSLILLFLGLVLPFVLGPILVHRLPGIKAHPSLVEISEEAARRRFPPNSFRTIAQLEQLGFSLVAHLMAGDQITRMNAMVSILVNRESKTMVALNRVFTNKAVLNTTVESISFSTEFADGTEIMTSNTPIVTIFRDVPRVRRLNIPQLRDVWRLYSIHSYYVANRYVANRKDGLAVLPAPGEEISNYEKSYERELAEQMSLGYLRLDQETDRYRFNWLSSIVFTWRMLWPVKPLLLSHKKYRGRLIAKAAGISNL
jgi:hypothetical protein